MKILFTLIFSICFCVNNLDAQVLKSDMFYFPDSSYRFSFNNGDTQVVSLFLKYDKKGNVVFDKKIENKSSKFFEGFQLFGNGVDMKFNDSNYLEIRPTFKDKKYKWYYILPTKNSIPQEIEGLEEIGTTVLQVNCGCDCSNKYEYNYLAVRTKNQMCVNIKCNPNINCRWEKEMNVIVKGKKKYYNINTSNTTILIFKAKSIKNLK